MLASCEQHVHDDTDGEHVHTCRVLALLDQLRAHEDQCSNLVCIIVLLIFRTQAEVSDFDTREIVRVRNEDIVWFQISMYNLIRVKIVNSLEDGFDNLGCFLIGEVYPLLLPRQNQLGKLTSTHEFHSEKNFALDLFELEDKIKKW